MICGRRNKKALLKEIAELRQELEQKNNELQAVRTQLEELQRTKANEGQAEAFLGPFVEESVFYQVFGIELIQDILFSYLCMKDKLLGFLDLEDLQNLQLTSRRLNECVMGHLPTWRHRTIVIDAVDGDILTELDFEHSHLSWKSAKVNLVSWSEEIQRLERLWNQLERLELTSNSYAEGHDENERFDERILPNFLSRCTQLESLRVDQKLLWTCPVNSFPVVANALRKLTTLDLRGGPHLAYREMKWKTEFRVQELIKDPWSMEAFRFECLPDITAQEILCTNVMSNLIQLSAQVGLGFRGLGNTLSYPDLPNLQYLYVTDTCKLEDGHLLNILKCKAPFLRVIKINTLFEKCPLEVLKALEVHANVTLLESLDISAAYFETRREGIENQEDSIFSFLSNCICLNHLKIAVTYDVQQKYKRSQPQPTCEQILSKLPKNLETLELRHIPTAIRLDYDQKINFDQSAGKDLENHFGVQLPKLKSYILF